MIIVPKKNLYLPKRVWGIKRFQRGILVATAIHGTAGAAGVVTISGENIWNFITNSANLWFNASGIVEKQDFDPRQQIDAATDWIIPNASASSAYDIRLLNLVGTLTTQWAAENVWIDLGTTRNCGKASGTADIDVEIRKDGGAALDSGHYQLIGALA